MANHRENACCRHPQLGCSFVRISNFESHCCLHVERHPYSRRNSKDLQRLAKTAYWVMSIVFQILCSSIAFELGSVWASALLRKMRRPIRPISLPAHSTHQNGTSRLRARVRFRFFLVQTSPICKLCLETSVLNTLRFKTGFSAGCWYYWPQPACFAMQQCVKAFKAPFCSWTSCSSTVSHPTAVLNSIVSA